MQTYKACYRSEIGPLEIVGNAKGILMITFVDKALKTDRTLPACIKECLRQLDEYFKGRRKKFSVPVLLGVTNFHLN